MNLPTLYCEEQIIKILVDRLTHVESHIYIWEWEWNLQSMIDLWTMRCYRDVNFVTACKILEKLKNDAIQD